MANTSRQVNIPEAEAHQRTFQEQLDRARVHRQILTDAQSQITIFNSVMVVIDSGIVIEVFPNARRDGLQYGNIRIGGGNVPNPSIVSAGSIMIGVRDDITLETISEEKFNALCKKLDKEISFCLWAVSGFQRMLDAARE